MEGHEGRRPHVGMRVKLRRIELGLTIEEVVKRSGVNRNTISKLERSERGIHLSNFIAICQVLDVSPVRLICGTDQWDSEKVAM